MEKNNLLGFSLIELLVVISIIGILSSITLVSFGKARIKSRDVRRKSEISQFGKFLTNLGCYLPDSGGGEYDVADLFAELMAKYPQYQKYLSQVPKDPKTGTDVKTNYIYTVSDDGGDCALYANLENENEKVTLLINWPTPGGGTGVLTAGSDGWNGSPIYFQYSN